MRPHRGSAGGGSAGGACFENGKHREQGWDTQKAGLWPAF